MIDRGFDRLRGGGDALLAPGQVRIITLNDGAALIDYAKPIVIEFRASMVRVEAGVFIIRLHHGGPQGAKPKGEVVVDILRAIKERQT